MEGHTVWEEPKQPRASLHEWTVAYAHRELELVTQIAPLSPRPCETRGDLTWVWHAQDF